MARTLKPDDRISRYRIIGPLGAGGMGEVYRARDETLERDVALKILPPEVVRSEERVRRFMLEAKSASSLNHPNIVTIYEIGQDQIRAADGSAEVEAESTPVHFISMELVEGETFASKIHREKTDLRTLLGWLAQAAEGLAKAHAAGIVHRDLKPGNIMVSKDGYAKVLDFGLAKLTEKKGTEFDLASAPTETSDRTGEGVVLGTAGYMSPEQVQGKTVDPRSDIFSFGCILYEAATRRQPFEDGSNVDTMHKILHDKPAPIEELNPKAPAELRRLIRRCLAKDPNQRLDSMKALAIELRDIVEEYDALSPSGSSGSGATAAASAARAGRRQKALVTVAVVVLVGIAGVAVGLWALRQRRGTSLTAPFQSMRMTTLTSVGSLVHAVLSPDGRYIAYTKRPAGSWGLWVHQVSTGSDVEILPPQQAPLSGLAFSPDGDYLFFLNRDPEMPEYQALFQVPSLGGTPRKRANDVDSAVTFAPDGKRICFRRGDRKNLTTTLVVLDLESGQERRLATPEAPLRFASAPSWSPDGQRIAVAEFSFGAGGDRARLVAFGSENGRRETFGSTPWRLIGSIVWLPDGRGLVVSAGEAGGFAFSQLWLQPLSGEPARRITNDSNYYTEVTVSSDGATIAATRGASLANLWRVDADGSHEVRQLTFNSNMQNSVSGFDLGEDGSIVFGARRDDEIHLSRIGIDGSDQQPITTGGVIFGRPRCLPGGGIVYNQRVTNGPDHIWHANAEGGSPTCLTTGSGEGIMDVSPDGRTVLFNRRETPCEIWTISPKGGPPARLDIPCDGEGGWISPDGSRLAYHSYQGKVQGPARGVWTIFPIKGGEPIATAALPPQASAVGWAPDGESLSFLDGADPAWNLFRQRLAGGKPEQLTHFAPEISRPRIYAYEWSPDGKRLVLARGKGLWLAGPNGETPALLTEFNSGDIFTMKWSRDARRVIFVYGNNLSDAVLIRNFR